MAYIPTLSMVLQIRHGEPKTSVKDKHYDQKNDEPYNKPFHTHIRSLHK